MTSQGNSAAGDAPQQSGTVLTFEGSPFRVNDKLTDSPALVNEDPLGAGWFFKMKLDDMSVLDQFMDEDEYNELIA